MYFNYFKMLEFGVLQKHFLNANTLYRSFYNYLIILTKVTNCFRLPTTEKFP